MPGLPHHVTQRGNRRERVFFTDDDYRAYLDLIGAAARRSGTEIWVYCLMPKHLHVIMMASRVHGEPKQPRRISNSDFVQSLYSQMDYKAEY